MREEAGLVHKQSGMSASTSAHGRAVGTLKGDVNNQVLYMVHAEVMQRFETPRSAMSRYRERVRRVDWHVPTLRAAYAMPDIQPAGRDT